MQLCKHDKYKVVDWILEPKYSTDEVLVNTTAVTPEMEHYLLKFKKCNKYPDWFYMSGKTIRSHKTQKNGNGTVYVVPMSEREDFHPIQECEHLIK